MKTMSVKWNEKTLAMEMVSMAQQHFAFGLLKEELWNTSPKLFVLRWYDSSKDT